MKVSDYSTAPGGFVVTVEVERAYTDGKSRFDKVFLPYDEVAGRTPEQVLAAIKRETAATTLAELRGRSLDEVEPAPARERLDERLARLESKVDEVRTRPTLEGGRT